VSERSRDWPIVIGGCHRSGTSLVCQILDAHSRIHCGTEVKFFRDLFGDYRKDPLRHLRFTTTARSLVSATDLLEVLGQAFIELHRRAASKAGKPRWADKAPENILYTEQWGHLLRGEWLFLHVVRNPLDTLASMVEATFPHTLPREFAERVSFYRRYTEAGLEFAKARPDQYLRIVYEELVEFPKETVTALMGGLCESFEPSQLALGGGRRGLEDPKIAGTSRPHRESLGRWPQVLTSSEARFAWRELGSLWAEVAPGLEGILADMSCS
jgi:Sulfotransferase family